MEHHIIRRHILNLKRLCKKNVPQEMRDELAIFIAEAIQLQAVAEQKRSLDLFKYHIKQYAIVRKAKGWHVRAKLHEVR